MSYLNITGHKTIGDRISNKWDDVQDPNPVESSKAEISPWDRRNVFEKRVDVCLDREERT
jgi:hypothetical protein